MFEHLRDALRAALDAGAQGGDLRELARAMREAVIEARAGVAAMRDALARSDAELAAERRRLADAERRGRLAAEIQDAETVEVARRFAAKHGERVAMLEKKIAAQREELALAERDLAEMHDQLKAAERDRAAGSAARSAERAWRDVTAAGGARPGTDAADELVRGEIDRAAREAEAERQLQALKKKLGKE